MSEPMRHKHKVKIAIVGCGKITKSGHLPAALRSSKIEVSTLVDNQVNNARALSKEFSLTCDISDDLKKVINQVDGVVVATPNHLHYSVAKIALEKGLPVLIEKPITTVYKDAIDLCSIADKTDAFVSVGYTTRHYPSVKTFKNLLENSYFGKINSFHYEYGSKGGWAPLSGYNIDRKKSGGGVLVVSGTHFIDRMLYWFGEPKDIIYRDDSYGGVEANCKAKLTFENDLGTFSGTFFMSKTTKLRNAFFMDTEKYLCEFPESSSNKITLFPKNDTQLKLDVSSITDVPISNTPNYFQSQLEEFADNIRHRKGLTVDGWAAALSIKLIEEMYSNRLVLDEPWISYKEQRGPNV
jgi:predicted dehydrogenase